MVAMATAAVPVPLWRSKPSSRAIIRTVDDRFASASLTLREIKAPKDRERFATELAKLEKRQLTTTFKFGVLYAKGHQTTEEEMFSNTTGSPGFERFLDMLGERTRLKGWTRFRAGLDVQSDTTGTHSVYTTMDDFEIMFHVSTLLPHNPRDPQQVERKRHIGNDICVIVYLDAPGPGEVPRSQPIEASLIHSDYTHILAIVEPTVGDPMAPDDERDRYTLTMCCKNTVPRYGPPLATGGHYMRDEYFRQVLLTKLINGENACGSAQVFESKLVRTRTALYKAFVESFAS